MMVVSAAAEYDFSGGLVMDRDPQCIVLNRGKTRHLLHLQTQVAVLDVEKLKRIVACNEVTPRAKALAQRKLDILQRDNFTCVKCGETQCLTVDHVEKLVVEFGLENFERSIRAKIRSIIRSTAEGYPMEKCQTVCVWCHGEKDGWLKDGVRQ